MTCQDFDIRLADYLAGALTSADAAQLEAHAVGCARCELRLDAATRAPIESFAPALPPALRSRTLAAVALRRGAGERDVLAGSQSQQAADGARVRGLSEAERMAPQRWARWWGGSAALAAAAALIFVVSSPGVGPSTSTRLVDSSRTTPSFSPLAESLSVTSSPSVQAISLPGGAEGLAVFWSQAEFTELDRAADELRAALADAPDDEELRAFLSSVTARRDELARRVKEAAS